MIKAKIVKPICFVTDSPNDRVMFAIGDELEVLEIFLDLSKGRYRVNCVKLERKDRRVYTIDLECLDIDLLIRVNPIGRFLNVTVYDSKNIQSGGYRKK